MAGANITHANLIDAYPGSVSAECDGHGFVLVIYPDEDVRRSGSVNCAACERGRLLGSIGAFTPPRFRDAIDAPHAIAEWAARGQKAQGLYLTGPVGTGKTHAAWAALAAWCLATGTVPDSTVTDDWYGRQGPTVIFTRMTDLLDDLRPGDDGRQRIRDCQGADLLALDDIGAEKASEWTQERLYSIIDQRYVHCRPLIVTSNLPPAALAEQTGKRTASRLAEMCVVVPMTGDDRRMPAA